MRNKVLIIEDDKGLALALKDFFEENALRVWHAASGEEGLTLYYKEKPDLIVLDVMLPHKSGFDVIAEIHDKDINLPVIMMTGTEFDVNSQVKGFTHGAINYVQKPILPQVLLAQIKSTLAIPQDLVQYQIGGITIRIHAQYAEFNTKQHKLREKDIKLLNLLLQRKNQVVHRSSILKQIWRDDHPDNNDLLNSTMSRIRKLLKQYPSLQINTVYGGGYRLQEKLIF
ncbi:MAG TPA: response regulator transcription factor [Sphingobacterium sp.]|nr:response regulator transcription factor [Sphingobacterium sp.]